MSEVNHFSGARAAGIGSGGTKLKPGRYPCVRIDACKVHPGHHGLKYIVGLTPVAPGFPTGPQENGKTYEPTPVDVGGDWATRIDGPQAKSGWAEANGFAAQVTGCDDLIKLETLLHQSAQPGSPGFAGKHVSVTIYIKVTSNGHDMYKAIWGDADMSAIGSAAPAPAPEGIKPAAVPGDWAPTPPAVTQAPLTPEQWPPSGWYLDPHGRGYYNAAGEIKTEAELRA